MNFISAVFLVSLVWESTGNAPGARAYPAGAGGYYQTDSSFPYLPAVYGASSSSVSNTNYWYNIFTDSWSTRSSGPSPSVYDQGGTFHPYGGSTQLFVFGGSDGVSSNAAAHRYNYSTDSWSNISSLPRALEGPAAASFGSYIYVMGGHEFDVWNDSGVVNNNYRYDPVANSYTSRAGLPTAVADAGIAVANNRIYLFGGIVNSSGTPTSSVQEYDPSSNTWRSRANMPVARSGVSVAVLRGLCYVMGGTNLPAGPVDYNRVDIYDPVANTWSSGPSLPSARDGGAATAPDLPLQGVNLIWPDNDTVCTDTIFVWNRGDGAVKIVFACGGDAASNAYSTTWLLKSVVQGYVLRYGTDPTLSSGYTQVWNDASGSSVDDVDTTESLPGGTGGGLSPNTWYYWTVGAVDDMGDTAWSSDTFRFYHCDPTYYGIEEREGATGYALSTGPEGAILFTSPVAQNIDIRVYDPAGKLIAFRKTRVEPGQNRFVLPLNGNGVFIVQIKTEKGPVLRTRLINIR